MPENYESDIRRLATNLRLGSSIASLYKEVPFKNPGEYVRDLLERIWEQRVRDRMLRNRQKAGFEKLKTLRDFQPDNLELPRGGRCQPFFPLIYKVLHLCFLRGSAPSAFGGFPRGFLGPQRCSLWRAVGFLQCAV